MPAITETEIQSIGKVTATQITLNGTDTFAYDGSQNKYLFLRNPTAGALSPIIDGADAVPIHLAGVGNVATSGGFAVGSIAAGATVVVDLYAIRNYLKGIISITAGTGLIAILAHG